MAVAHQSHAYCCYIYVAVVRHKGWGGGGGGGGGRGVQSLVVSRKFRIETSANRTPNARWLGHKEVKWFIDSPQFPML